MVLPRDTKGLEDGEQPTQIPHHTVVLEYRFPMIQWSLNTEQLFEKLGKSEAKALLGLSSPKLRKFQMSSIPETTVCGGGEGLTGRSVISKVVLRCQFPFTLSSFYEYIVE